MPQRYILAGKLGVICERSWTDIFRPSAESGCTYALKNSTNSARDVILRFSTSALSTCDPIKYDTWEQRNPLTTKEIAAPRSNTIPEVARLVV